jgi:hypothetical protein
MKSNNSQIKKASNNELCNKHNQIRAVFLPPMLEHIDLGLHGLERHGSYESHSFGHNICKEW